MLAVERVMKRGELVKAAPVGFSWTTLFFGPLPALFRGDLKWGIIMFLVHFAVASVTFGFGVLVTAPIFAAIYNGRFRQDLLEAGWIDDGRTMAEYWQDKSRKAATEDDETAAGGH